MTRDVIIHDALGGVAAMVNRIAAGRWAFSITNGTTTTARAHVDGEWLVLAAQPTFAPDGALPCVWSMLAWNAALGGGVRFAVGAWAPAPELRADVALDAGADLGRRIAEACGGFVTAMSYLHEPGAQPSRATVADAPAGGDELAFLCRETRWSVKERGPGSLAVDLDVPGAFHQALVEERQGGRVSVSVPVFEATTVRTEPASETCRQALGIFLARMCGVVRMARAAAESNAGRAPRFEVLHVQPTVAELDHGFAALSVAYRLAVQEAAVLWHDDTVASAYVRQWDDAVAHRAA